MVRVSGISTYKYIYLEFAKAETTCAAVNEWNVDVGSDWNQSSFESNCWNWSVDFSFPSFLFLIFHWFCTIQFVDCGKLVMQTVNETVRTHGTNVHTHRWYCQPLTYSYVYTRVGIYYVSVEVNSMLYVYRAINIRNGIEIVNRCVVFVGCVQSRGQWMPSTKSK